MHGLMNTLGLGIYLISLRERRNNRRGPGVFLSSLGLGLMTVSAWLGDELTYRYNGGIYAIGAICGHDGGRLERGRFEGYCAECPWHQSAYDLRDGRVVHGPTAYAKPSYDTRVKDGMVEIRLRSGQQGGLIYRLKPGYTADRIRRSCSGPARDPARRARLSVAR